MPGGPDQVHVALAFRSKKTVCSGSGISLLGVSLVVKCLTGLRPSELLRLHEQHVTAFKIHISFGSGLGNLKIGVSMANCIDLFFLPRTFSSIFRGPSASCELKAHVFIVHAILLTGVLWQWFQEVEP